MNSDTNEQPEVKDVDTELIGWSSFQAKRNLPSLSGF
jgi:hypothetical protein